MPQILAVFDMDFTLIETDSEVRWSKYLHDLGIVDDAYMRQIHRFDLDYLRGCLDYHAFDRTLLSPLQALDKAACDSLVSDFLPLLRPLIRPWMMEVVEEHRRAGHRVVLASAANSYLGEKVAAMLGFSDMICTTSAMRDGKPTGEIVGEPAFREGKAHKLQEFAADNDVSFEQSYAYSDSHNDIPLLSLVGHPVAVTPDPMLLRHAKMHGWQVIRKPLKSYFARWFNRNETVAP